MSDHSQFASDEIRDLLQSNGVTDLESAFCAGDSLDAEHEQRATRHNNRRVLRLELTAAAGPMTVYIKRQWRRGRLLPRPTDIRHRINLQCSPLHEWRGLRALEEAGFHVSQPLAVFWRGWGLSRGAVITRAVPPARSMADMLLRGEFERMDDARRKSLIEAAANVAAAMHRARISWRSMKAKHFYPEEIAPGQWRIWLIDCEGVYRRATRRDCQREWRNYLTYFTSRAPAMQESFSTAYAGALSNAAA